MAISNPVVTVNGVVVAIVPNSAKYDEGQPEKNIRAAVSGTETVQDFSEDQATQFSSCSFSLYPGVDNIELAREWGSLKNTNIVTFTGTETVLGVDQSIERTFANASVTNKPEVAFGNDTEFEVQFQSDPAV